MSRIVNIDVGDKEKMCLVCKALSVPTRIDILQLIENKGLSIGEIAEHLNIPQSSVTFHINILQKADLINVEERPGRRGTLKLCRRKTDYINLSAYRKNSDINSYVSYEMPIGAYCDCTVTPTCGLANKEGIIGVEDKISSFYLPERISAGILWTAYGAVTYRFPNVLPAEARVMKLMMTFEICSEAPNYHENWKSDITFLINQTEVGTWCSPGDYGSRRGRLNPPTWEAGSTQYGMMVGVEISDKGVVINGKKHSPVTIDDLKIEERPYIEFTICNKTDAVYKGGFNLFGKTFGDYEQDIIMGMEYKS